MVFSRSPTTHTNWRRDVAQSSSHSFIIVCVCYSQLVYTMELERTARRPNRDDDDGRLSFYIEGEKVTLSERRMCWTGDILLFYLAPYYYYNYIYQILLGEENGSVILLILHLKPTAQGQSHTRKNQTKKDWTAKQK